MLLKSPIFIGPPPFHQEAASFSLTEGHQLFWQLPHQSNRTIYHDDQIQQDVCSLPLKLLCPLAAGQNRAISGGGQSDH